LPGSPITGPGDLKGRRLGLPLRLRDGLDWWRGQVLAGFEQALHEAGLGFDDVTLVDIPVDRAYVEDVTTGTDQGRSLWGVRSQFALQREETAALIRGEVDAIYSDAALGALLRSFTGAQLVVPIRANQDEAEGDFGHPTVLTASGALIDERPDLVERWVGRLLDARDWALAHRSEARRIIANDSGLPEDLVELAHSPRLYEQLDVALDEGRIAIFRHKHDSLVRHGLLEKPLDFDRFIDARPLQAVLAHRTRPVEAAA
jgi:ABC-type nitrate/sulfonate/bicarbonate transport system substrate-binding protein